MDYAIFLTDVRSTILTWTKGVEELLGYSEEEFIGKDASMIFTPEDRVADVPATDMQRASQDVTLVSPLMMPQVVDARWSDRLCHAGYLAQWDRLGTVWSGHDQRQ